MAIHNHSSLSFLLATHQCLPMGRCSTHHDRHLTRMAILRHNVDLPRLICHSRSDQIAYLMGSHSDWTHERRPLLGTSSALSQQIRMNLVTDALLETLSGAEATLIPVNAQTTVCSIADWLSKRGATTRIGPTLESLAKDRVEPQVAPGDDNKIALAALNKTAT